MFFKIRLLMFVIVTVCAKNNIFSSFDPFILLKTILLISLFINVDTIIFAPAFQENGRF